MTTDERIETLQRDVCSLLSKLERIDQALVGTPAAQYRDGLHYRLNRMEERDARISKLSALAIGAATISVIGAVVTWMLEGGLLH